MCKSTVISYKNIHSIAILANVGMHRMTAAT